MPVQVKGYLLIAMATTLWGLAGAVAKYFFNQALSPFILVQVRLTVSAILLVVFLYLRYPGLLRLDKADYKKMILFGVLGMASVQFFYLYTISQLNVAPAVFLQSIAPAIIALYSVVWKREKLGSHGLVALVLACVGSALIITNQVFPGMQWPWKGILSGFASAVALSFFILYGKGLLARYNSWEVLAYGWLFGAIPWWFLVPPWVVWQQHYGWETWLFFLYICVFATIIPFGLSFRGLHYLQPSRASIAGTLEPVMAGVFAYFLLGETLTGWQLLGCALILAAVVILQLEREAPTAAPAPAEPKPVSR